MSTISELHARAVAFLTQPTPPPSPARIADAFGPPRPDSSLNLFLPNHLAYALGVTRQFMEIANVREGNDGLEGVLSEAERLRGQENLDLLKYALLVFITHHPQGRRLPIPPLDQRSPRKVAPSNRAVALGLEPLGALGAEAGLDYFREDTAVNDHHNKWHVVYPGDGHPNPDDPNEMITKDRQGELFWYMHQQMLARYDAERQAFGLARVAPLEDYRTAIAEGYDSNIPGYSDRAPNAKLADLPIGPTPYRITDHETRRDRLREAAQNGVLRRGDGTSVPITPSLLGDTLEATIGSADDGEDWGSPFNFYGQLHNFGHVFLAYAQPPDGGFPDEPGVMTSTDTAVRDPVFFRWHRHVDDLFVLWQETLPSRDFAGEAPPVQLRKGINGGADDQSPDILLAFAEAIPGAAAEDFDGQAYAQATFGGANWDAPLSSFDALTNELETFMREEAIELPDGTPGVKPYLDHKEFIYFFRLENMSTEAQKVTVRVFLVPKLWADDRRMWIEMDKFAHSLEPQQRAVIFRPARWSSVVRKPALRPSEPRPPQEPGTAGTNYCDCGWPYHLLLPRGTETGMDFRLMVALSDHQADLVGAEKKCGSMSFCGARDAKYPDSKPMGYPFDRPFRDATITQTLATHEHMAARDVKIRHSGDHI